MGQPISDYSDDELGDIKESDIDQLRCDRCGYTWEPTKHPSEYSRLSCPAEDCGHQSQADIILELDPDGDETVEYEPDPATTERYRSEPDDGISIDFSDALDSGSANFDRMTPGEFIEWFFTEDLEEVNVKSTSILAKKCDIGNRLPTKSQMEWILGELNTQVGNHVEIDWIAESYWNSAREYISHHLGIPVVDIDRHVIEHDSEWVKLDNSRGMRQPEPTGTTTTVSEPPGQEYRQGGGTAVMDGGASQAPPAQQQQPPQQDDSQNEAILETFKTVVENQQTLADRIERVGASNQQQQQDVDQFMKQFSQFKSMMDEFTDGGDSMSNEQLSKLAEGIQANQQRMQSLEQKLGSDDSDQPVVPSGAGMEAVIPLLAQRDDVNPDVITELATAVGGVESDPEVKKKQIDRDIELKKLERENEKVEKAFEGLENVAETLAETGVDTVINALTGGGDDDDGDSAPQKARPARERQQQEIKPAEPIDPPGRQRREGSTTEIKPTEEDP